MFKDLDSADHSIITPARPFEIIFRGSPRLEPFQSFPYMDLTSHMRRAKALETFSDGSRCDARQPLRVT